MKICPLLLISNIEVDRNSQEPYACIQERCAWWIHTRIERDCAVIFLTDIFFRIAAAKFPSAVSVRNW